MAKPLLFNVTLPKGAHLIVRVEDTDEQFIIRNDKDIVSVDSECQGYFEGNLYNRHYTKNYERTQVDRVVKGASKRVKDTGWVSREDEGTPVRRKGKKKKNKDELTTGSKLKKARAREA